MKSQIPGGVPRVFPLVWHGDHVGVVEMGPFMVSTVFPPSGWRRICRVAFKPVLDNVMVKLLRPQEPAKRLTHDILRIWCEVLRNNRGVELVRLALALQEDTLEVSTQVFPNGRWDFFIGEP